MSFNIGIGLALDGEKEFKAGIREVTSELKLLQSQSKEIEARYGDNAKSLEALTEKHENLSKQLEQANKKVELNSEQLKTWQNVNENAGQRVEELKEQLADAEDEMKRMQSSADTTTEELEQQQKVVEELENKLQNAERAYETSENKVSKYKISLTNAKTEATKINTELEKNSQSLKEAEAATEDTTDAVEDYEKEVGNASDKTSIFGDVLKANLVSELVIQGAKKIAEGIKEISSSAVSVGSSFESSMSQVAATMGITAEEIEAGSRSYEILEEAAKKSGKETKYSASQAGEALNYLALAGYDAQKAAETLPSVLSIASAGGMDLAYASDLVTDSMAALGIETSQLNNYIDEMARTAQKSNTSVAQLGEATLVCAGTVSLSNQSLETMNSELGVLANRGIKGAEGGTHLRNIILSLSAPTKTAAKEIKSLGLNITDSQGNMRDMNDIMVDLKASLDGLSSSEKTRKISAIFNKTDIAAVNALLEGTGDEFENLKAQLKDCEGAAQNMAETMEANLAGKVTILQSALESLGISAYEKIEGTLKNSVDAATDSVGKLQDSMDNGKLGRSMDEFASALGDAAEGAIGFAEDALPLVIDGLSWVLENSDLVIAGIAGITAANLEMKVIGPAIEAVTAAWKAYKTANEEATVAQWLLTTAMNASPAGILITAIVGITTAVAAYAAINATAAGEVREMLDANQEQIDTLNTEISSRKDATAANEAEIGTLKILKTQLSELNSKEKLSTEEKNKMKLIVQQLNQEMPELNLIIDEQTGKLAENTEGWEANAEAQLAVLEAKFRQADAEEAAHQYYEADKQRNEIIEQRKQTEQELAEVTEEYNKFLKDNSEALNDVTAAYALNNEADNYRLRIAELTDAVKEQTEQEEELSATMDDLESEYQELAEAAETAATGAETLATQTIYFEGVAYEATAEVAAAQETLRDAYDEVREKAEEAINGQVGLFQELKTESDLTVQQMADNLASQKDTYTQYTENLAKAAQIMKEDTTGSFDDIVQSIMDMGISGAGYLDELVQAFEEGDESFQRVLDGWSEMSEAKEILIDTMADMQSGYSEQMKLLLNAQTEATASMADDWDTKSEEFVTTVSDANDKVIDATKATMQTLEKTVKEDGAKVVTATGEVAGNAISEAESNLEISGNESGTFKKIGNAVSTGMAAGIREQMHVAIEAAREIAREAYNASKTELQVNSPSKKARWLGEMYAEGFGEGTLERLGEMNAQIRSAMADMVNMDAVETPQYGNIDLTGASSNALTEEMLSYLKVIADKSGDLYLDGNTLVGKLMPQIDQRMQQSQTYYMRGGVT